MKTVRKISAGAKAPPKRKRVAAYARVSMESDRLAHSLSAQISYYSGLIQKNPEWEFAGVYADRFVSGTSAERRAEFQRMLASFAQEESRSISENVKWGTRKRFEQGIPNGKFRVYGYRWKGDELVPVPEEAAIVKRIFQNFLDGKSRLDTEKEFAAEGIKTRNGCPWVDSNIKSVLTNITYTGNLLLQKEFIEDPITKKHQKNKGQLPQYYVENDHEAIIDMKTFQFVQEEIARRRELGVLANKSLNITCFTGKIKCGLCGKSYIRNQRNNRTMFTTTYTDGYVTWMCGSRKIRSHLCKAKEIPEKILKQISAEVLGLDEFDEKVFAERVQRITVPSHGLLVFRLTDGAETSREWKSNAKKECWTDEYKGLLRERMRNFMARGTGRFSAFTTRIKCGRCGGSVIRCANHGGPPLWKCGSRCGIASVRESELREISARMMGLPEFDSEAFKSRIDHVEMEENGRLRFFFADGHTEETAYTARRRAHSRSMTEEQRERFIAKIKASWVKRRLKKETENHDTQDNSSSQG